MYWFQLSQEKSQVSKFWFWKSQLEFWLLLATCWVWREMRLTLAFSSCCCLKIGSAGMYYFYATRCTTYQLPWYAFRVRSSLKIAFMCTTWTISSHSPTCRISLIAAILTDFKQVLALPSKCVGNNNWSTESSPMITHLHTVQSAQAYSQAIRYPVDFLFPRILICTQN